MQQPASVEEKKTPKKQSIANKKISIKHPAKPFIIELLNGFFIYDD